MKADDGWLMAGCIRLIAAYGWSIFFVEYLPLKMTERLIWKCTKREYAATHKETTFPNTLGCGHPKQPTESKIKS